MKRHSTTASLSPFASRAIGAKVLSCTLLLAVVGLLALGRARPDVAARWRAEAVDVVAPIVHVVQSPAAALGDATLAVRNFMHSPRTIAQLTLENQQLLKWQTEALRLKTENQELRELLRMVPAKAVRYISAVIVGDTSGQYTASALINAGTQQGVTSHQAVIGARGMVGYVIEAGNTSARILLLADINARVAVIGERSGTKAIVAGDGTGKLQLNYVAPSSPLVSGERLLTSGDGGYFPAGIPVARLDDDGANTLLATPFSNGVDARVVSVLDYTF